MLNSLLELSRPGLLFLSEMDSGLRCTLEGATLGWMPG